MKNVRQALERVDWNVLLDQKMVLLKACDRYPDLEGLLNFVDAIQDAAERDGFPVQFATEED